MLPRIVTLAVESVAWFSIPPPPSAEFPLMVEMEIESMPAFRIPPPRPFVELPLMVDVVMVSVPPLSIPPPPLPLVA